ncbi:hypothetical protein [Kribbella jiaozuonensis]|uniref:DUF8175 domain-containing protein n=1 Tax=Kribbella jiaozuonensis TaxID=2575441 RepID=A0A4U3LP73_9ACTN|nr:hypothetical protein [Kribbella jiaozuonensis]TKK77605.1 hypothetical protein FDA38_20820 [Kribbella jiaozuonensis]
MSDTSEEKSPFGRGFIAASIVIGAVVLCGAVLLIGNLTSSGATPAQAQQQAVVPTVPATEPGGGEPAVPTTPAGARPAKSGGCNRAAGDQSVPQQPPAVDGWEVSSRIVVPRSSGFGPAKTDADGFRRCFAHSPTGAVYAAYSAYAAMADQDKVVATARKLMVPGPGTDALIRELQTDQSASGYTVPQLAGYRVIDAGPDRVSLMLATSVNTAYMSLTLTLVWHDGDWLLQPPAVGEPVGAPFSQHRDLSDFVAWSGV